MASLLQSVISIFSGKVAGILISLAFTPILVRILSQSQFGLYASVLAGFSIVTLLSRGGLFDATRKTVAEHADDSTEVSSVISTSLFLSVVYGVVATGVVLLSLWLEIVPDRYTPYVWVLTGAILFTNVFAIVRGAFYGLQRESVGEALKIVRRLLYTAGGLSLAYIGYDVLGVFSAYALSFLLLSLSGAVVLARYSSFGLPRRSAVSAYGRRIASFGGYQLIGGLSAMLLYRTDILLVEFFKRGTFTALYQSAITPAEMIWFVPSAIQLAFLQHTASLWSSGEIGEINENIQTGFKYAVLSLTLFGVGLVVLAEPFLTVYFGSDYVDATTTLQVLIFGHSSSASLGSSLQCFRRLGGFELRNSSPSVRLCLMCCLIRFSFLDTELSVPELVPEFLTSQYLSETSRCGCILRSTSFRYGGLRSLQSHRDFSPYFFFGLVWLQS